MKYISRKILILIITILFITLLTFLAFHVLPGDPAQLILGTEASPEKVEALREQLGTNQPLLRQYTSWISGFARGDFGTSLKYQKPVAELIAGRLPVTLLLGTMVIVLTLAVGIPLGVFAARKQGTWIEQGVSLLTMLGVSVPGFFLSILFMWIFGLVLHFFAPGRFISWESDPAGCLRFMIWPALAIAVPQTATLVKYIRTSMIDELRSDYVRTARGNGTPENTVMYRHALRNAIVSVVPLIGMMIGEIFSGSIIVEQVSAIPGIGRLLVSSVTSRDFPLTQTLVVYCALIIVITNFLVDIVIQLIDPRIRLTE